MQTTLPPRRRAGAVLAVGLATLSGALAFAGPARAGTDAYYDATARAIGVDATLSNPSIPIGLVVEGIGPEADVHQTALQVGDAQAAFPYLGDTIPSTPGVLGGILGVPTPAYPAAAYTTYGQPASDVNYPGVTLHAQSLAQDTVADAVVGTAASGGHSSSTINVGSDGSLTSTATTDLQGLQIGSVFSIGAVHAQAKAVADSTGKITRTSSLTIGQISVPGGAISVPSTTPGTIPIPIPIPGIPNIPPQTVPTIPIPVVGGTTLPVGDIGFENGYFTVTLPVLGMPQQFAVPAQAVLDTFKAAGITITYQAEQDTTTGVIAPVLHVSTTLPSPPANMYFSGATDVTYTLGSAVATADLHPVPQVGGGIDGGITGVGFPTDPTSPGSTAKAVASAKPTASTKPTASGKPTASANGTGSAVAPNGEATVPAATGATAAPAPAPLAVDQPAGPPAPPADGGAGLAAAALPAPPSTDSGAVAAAPDTASTDPPSQASAGSTGAPAASLSLAAATGKHGLAGSNLSDIYLVFVAIGLITFASATALRLMGVRSLWSS